MRRREYLIAGGAVVGTGSIAASYLIDETRGAELDIGTIQLDNTNHLTPNETVEPTLSATLDYSYDSDFDVGEVTVELLASNVTQTPGVIASETLSNQPNADSGTVQLTGSLVGAPGFSQSDFTLSDGEKQTVKVDVRSRLSVYRPNGDLIQTATAEGYGELTIERKSLALNSGQLDGTAHFNVTTGAE